jgi:hypothetical protein
MLATFHTFFKRFLLPYAAVLNQMAFCFIAFKYVIKPEFNPLFHFGYIIWFEINSPIYPVKKFYVIINNGWKPGGLRHEAL